MFPTGVHHALRPLLMSCIATMLASPALCAAADTATSAVTALPGATGATILPLNAGPAPRALISLLLPLNAPEFSAPAGAVQKGCETALAPHASTVSLEIARTSADPDNISRAWIAAAGRGAGVIVGPLTRNAVTALASMLSSQAIPSGLSATVTAATDAAAPIPSAPITLTLNTPDDIPALPPRFYTFGLVLEQEARALARMAWSDGRRSSIVVQSKNPLAIRSSHAYAAEWQTLGGRIVHVNDVDASTDLVELKTRLAQPASDYSGEMQSDMIFLSADAEEARRVRPYLNNQTAVYATSLVNDGRQDPGANVDLAGIRFVDMPWMLQPDHPAVMVYPRPDYVSPELQRFYALGVDACRIANQLLTQSGRVNIDGVTGRLSLSVTPGAGGSAVTREPVLAVFADPSTSLPPPEPALPQ
jgi:outer membrane PBP1 activator LpoA protein